MLRRFLSWMVVFAAFTAGCDGDALPEPDGALESGPPLVVGGKADGGTELPAAAALAPGAHLEHDFYALFAPEDPVLTVELALIDEVIDARAEDAGDYDEGDNPFRIRYAVYNLRNPQIVRRLIAAERAGVDVQILIEDSQLSTDYTWNTADEALIAAGFELASSHRDLDDAGRRTADLIGIEGSGLMHLKLRLFERPGRAVLLSGSLNPGDNALLNDETVHVIRDQGLVARYAAAYEAVLRGERLRNSWDPEAAVNVLFSRPARGDLRPATRLFEWIAAEDEQILLMVYSLQDIEAAGHDGLTLVDLLVAKARAGVPVWAITDRKQSDGVDADGNPVYRNYDVEDRLRAGGVHVYEAINHASPFNAMHHKVGILGRTRLRVITDAANWSRAGLGTATRIPANTESMLFIDSERLDGGRTGRRYLAEWVRVLRRYAEQSAGDGEPAAEVVAAELMALPGWPGQTVYFEVEADTAWGETVYVRGDHPALFAWGEPGVGLTTDARSYPIWRSELPPELPVGAAFAWKLTASRRGARPRWESGDDRHGVVQATALRDDDVALQTGVWRD